MGIELDFWSRVSGALLKTWLSPYGKRQSKEGIFCPIRQIYRKQRYLSSRIQQKQMQSDFLGCLYLSWGYCRSICCIFSPVSCLIYYFYLCVYWEDMGTDITLKACCVLLNYVFRFMIKMLFLFIWCILYLGASKSKDLLKSDTLR